MKNRILLTILSLVLVLSMLPASVVFATEATETTGSAETTEAPSEPAPTEDPAKAIIDVETVQPSQAMVDMLKSMEGFAVKPYWDNSQYSVGYGTKPKNDADLQRYMQEGISREEAQELLVWHLENKAVSLKKLIRTYQLELTQAQYDSLLSFSYNCGAGWTSRDCTIRTAVIEGWTGNDFIFAMGEWSTAAGNINNGLIRRRMREANMYLNGIYSMDVPETYSYVLYDSGAGSSTVRIQQFDTALPTSFRAEASCEGFLFDGWYTKAYSGEKVEVLSADTNKCTLYAHWRGGDSPDAPQTQPDTVVSMEADENLQMLTDWIPVFEKPVKNAAVVDFLRMDRVVHIVAKYTDTNNVVWGQVEGSGWVNVKAAELTDKDPEKNITVTVTADAVNVRTGPGTNYSILGSINSGKQVTITKISSGSGYLWGRMESGWICLEYTDYDADSDQQEPAEPEKPAEPETPAQPVTFPRGATITGDRLRIRKGPSTGHGIEGYLDKGDRVTILEIQINGSMSWGRTDKGWISMDYARLDADTSQPESPEPKPTEPAPTEPAPTEPAPTEPAPTEPTPTEPAPTEPAPTEPAPTEPEKPVAQQGKVKVSSGRLRIRKGPGTSYGIVGYLFNGDAVEVTETKTVDGALWGKMEKGWISMQYVDLEVTDAPVEPEKPTEPEKPAEPENPESEKPQTGRIVLTSGKLRIRKDPGLTGKIVGYLANGDKVSVLEQKIVDGTYWGRIDSGWISMAYVLCDNPEPPETVEKTVTASVLNIRAVAGTSNAIVGYLYKGNRVEVLETTMVGNVTWCRIDRGWVSGEYLQ